MVRIRIRLQVNSDISDKLAMWLSRDDIVNTFPIRGPGTVECTRRASLGDGEECVDEGKLVRPYYYTVVQDLLDKKDCGFGVPAWRLM